MNSGGRLTGITVVIPTRNRVDLAIRAIESAVAQDLEVQTTVLVSDNSTDAEQAEQLSRYCESIAASGSARQPTLRYVRPGEDLAMSEHWEWARAQAELNKATSHVLYLTDRTLLKPGALKRLATVAASYPSHVISFNNDMVDDYQLPVALHREVWGDFLLRVPTRRLLDLVAELIIPRPLPRMLNTLVPVSALSDIANLYGAVFESVAPDFCFCFRHLQLSEEILYFDRSLTVMHGLGRSNGNSTSRGVASSDTIDFLKRARSRGGIATATTIPAVTTTYNVIANEYATASQDAPSPMPSLNQRAYLRTLARETDAFVPGQMKEANQRALVAAGVRFGRLARVRRVLAHYGHFGSVLGPRQFLSLSAERLLRPRPQVFDSVDSAIAAAITEETSPTSSSRHLGYLGGSQVSLG